LLQLTGVKSKNGGRIKLLKIVAVLPLHTTIVQFDLGLAGRSCNQITLLHRGKIVAAGPPAVVLAPQNLEPIYEINVGRDGTAKSPFTPRIPQT